MRLRRAIWLVVSVVTLAASTARCSRCGNVAGGDTGVDGASDAMSDTALDASADDGCGDVAPTKGLGETCNCNVECFTGICDGSCTPPSCLAPLQPCDGSTICCTFAGPCDLDAGVCPSEHPPIDP